MAGARPLLIRHHYLRPATGTSGSSSQGSRGDSLERRQLPAAHPATRQPWKARYVPSEHGDATMTETTLPQVPRLATAVEAAVGRGDACGREADERDLLHALAEQPEAVAGKALSMSGFSARSEIISTADVARRSCVDVLVDAEDVAVADGSSFLATEHVLYTLLRPGWDEPLVVVQ